MADFSKWWARLGLNQRPLRCQRTGLPENSRNSAVFTNTLRLLPAGTGSEQSLFAPKLHPNGSYRRERAGAIAETRQSSDKSPHLPSQRDQGLAGESLKACGRQMDGADIG